MPVYFKLRWTHRQYNVPRHNSYCVWAGPRADNADVGTATRWQALVIRSCQVKPDACGNCAFWYYLLLSVAGAKRRQFPRVTQKHKSHFDEFFFTGCAVSCQNCNFPLHWRHNGRDCVLNHQPYDCLLNRLFRRRSKKTSKLRVTGLCEGNSPPHKWPVMRKMFPFGDVIMRYDQWQKVKLSVSVYEGCSFAETQPRGSLTAPISGRTV